MFIATGISVFGISVTTQLCKGYKTAFQNQDEKLQWCLGNTEVTYVTMHIAILKDCEVPVSGKFISQTTYGAIVVVVLHHRTRKSRVSSLYNNMVMFQTC